MIFHLVHATARLRAIEAVRNAPDGWVVKISEPTRTLEQNSKLWPVLDDISKQLAWHGAKLSTSEWKDFLTASLIQQKVVPNMDGTGFIVLGTSTSKMTKSLFSDLLELALCFGTQHGVVWTDPTLPDEGP